MSDVILTDERGTDLNRADLVARLTLYDVYCIEKSIREGDYDYVSYICEQGKKGYDDLTDDELYNEWQECEAGYWNMVESEEQPYYLNTNNEMEYEQGRADHQADALAKDE